jgi:hypothetical protein
MKTRINLQEDTFRFHVIAQFGAARLVSRPDGRTELRGGSPADHADAREWLSLFMHEVVPVVVTGR